MKKLVALITDQPPPEDEPKGAKGGEKKGGSRAAKKSAKGDCKLYSLFYIKCSTCITLFRPMEFSIQLHTIKSGWSIVYIEGPQVIVSKKYYIFS